MGHTCLVVFFFILMYTYVSDEAGAVEEDQSQSKDRKDVSGGEDGVDDESVSGEDVNDYQQPDFNPSVSFKILWQY